MSEEIAKHQSHKFTRKLTFKAAGLSGVRAGTRPNRLCARNGCSFGDRVEDAKELLKDALMESSRLTPKAGIATFFS